MRNKKDSTKIKNESLSEKFNFRSNPNLKKPNVQIDFTEYELEEYIKCKNDYIYFILNYVKIINIDNGLMFFDLRDYQVEMLHHFHNNPKSITMIGRQSGKSATTVAYLLWLILFNDSHKVAILANKGDMARELLSRLQLMYEHLPLYMQQGVVEWNKGKIILENLSTVIASGTSGSAIRGSSVNTIMLDEFAFINNNLAEEFFSSVFPTISSGKNTKVLISSTPQGLNHFYKMWTEAETGKSEFKSLYIPWNRVPGRDEKFKQNVINTFGETYWNQEFGCQFLGSSNTLIESNKLISLVYKDPLQVIDNDVRIYEHPIKEMFDEQENIVQNEHIYCMTVDVSEGVNKDYHAFSVIDVSSLPYKQVATFRNNSLSPLLYPAKIKFWAEYYNNAYVLVETNCNPHVAINLIDELEYENVFRTSVTHKHAAQAVLYYGGSGTSYGIKTSHSTKRIGCSNLKTLIENDKLIINDFETISELTTFVANKNTFSAEEGKNDDLAITLVIFAWLSEQKAFTDLVDINLRKKLQEEILKFKESEFVPIGIVDMTRNFNYEIIDNDVWFDSKDDFNEAWHSLWE